MPRCSKVMKEGVKGYAGKRHNAVVRNIFGKEECIVDGGKEVAVGRIWVDDTPLG